MTRECAEIDPNYKQIIVYSIFRFGDLVFRYKRSSRSGETRLHSFCSIGIGGHVKRQDVPLEVKSILEIFDLARVREAQEEFDFTWTGKPVLLGVLNDESNSVGKVHLGIVYEYWLASAIVRPREYRTPIDCGFVSIPELMPHSLEYETWSQIIIKDHLSSRD